MRRRDQELLPRVGRRVAEARKARGFTQAQLAEAVGLESVSLSRLETGDRALSLTTLGMIAAALDIGLGQLLGVEAELPRPTNGPEEVELLRAFASLTNARRDLVLRLVRELAG